MGKPSPKTAKIRAAIVSGMPVSKIADRYGVSPAYVYKLRKDMGPVLAPVPKAKPPRRKPVVKVAPEADTTIHNPPSVLVVPPTLEKQADDILSRPANLTPPVFQPPKSAWQRVKDFLRGAR